MLAHPFDGQGPSSQVEFALNVRLVLAKAITDRASAEGLFLPDRDRDVTGSKDLTAIREIHSIAGRISAEMERIQTKLRQGSRREERLQRRDLDRGRAHRTRRASLVRRDLRRRAAIVTHRDSMTPEARFRVKRGVPAIIVAG